MIINSTVLMIALVFFVSSVYAWFSFIYESGYEHYIYVGNFSVDLRTNDQETFTGALNINLSDMYPIRDQKIVSNTPSNYLYRFQVINLGTVPAMFRFVVVAANEAGGDEMPLSKQLKYNMRMNTSTANLDRANTRGTWSEPTNPNYQYVFDDKAPAGNVSLQKAFEKLLVSSSLDDPRESYTADGEIKANGVRYFDVSFWLSDQATTDTANYEEDERWYGKSATIVLKAYFLQSIGGAKWPLEWEKELTPKG